MQLYRSEPSQQFIDMFTRQVGLSEEEFDLLLSHFKREYIPRKYFYLKAGQVCNQKAYVNKGSARIYTLDEGGNEHIIFFAFEDWWLGDLESYYTQQPGKLYVQAMEDCELLCISKTDFDQLQSQVPALKEWDIAKKRNLTLLRCSALWMSKHFQAKSDTCNCWKSTRISFSVFRCNTLLHTLISNRRHSAVCANGF